MIEFGKTISYIRKEKNIPVKNLIDNKMSRASYTRFTEGKNHTSINNFVALLDGLHITFEEFLYINRGFETADIYRILNKTYELFLNHQIDDLRNLLNKVITYIKDNKVHNLIHTACIIRLTLDVLEKKSYNIGAKNIIRDYLLKCEIWTHYELVIFNNIMFIFDIDTINILSKRVLHNLEKYQNMRGYGSESFRSLINILTIYINNKELRRAEKMLSTIENFSLGKDMLFEKNIRQLYIGLVSLLTGNQNGKEKIINAMNVFKFTNSNEYFNFYKNYLTNTAHKYNL